MKTDNSGRQWRLIERRSEFQSRHWSHTYDQFRRARACELWRADDADLMAHGWAVCLPGDEPDHATWSTTTTEAVARQWFAQ